MIRAAFFALALLSPRAASAGALVNGAPPVYPTISGAFAAASSADTIEIEPGIYDEVLDLHGIPVLLQGLGAGPDEVVIRWDAAAPNDAVVLADDDLLVNLTVTSSVNRAVYVDTAAVVVLDSVLSSTLSGAAADPNGGCILAAPGVSVDVENSTVIGCSAPGDGGAVFVGAGGSMASTGSWFLDNVAGGEGGAIAGGAMGIQQSTFCGNAGLNFGGAILGIGADSVFVYSSSFVSNSAGAQGAAVYFASGGGALSNTTLLANSGPGAIVFASDPAVAPSFRNNLVAHHPGSTGIASAGVAIAAQYSAFFDNALDAVPAPDGTNLTDIDPLLIRFSDDGDCGNDLLHLQPGSALVDAGDPATTDPDGTVADIGAFGGYFTLAAWFLDADGDGFPAAYECDDSRPEAFFGAPELCNDLDEDCDLVVDNDPTDPLPWFADRDGDLFGDPASPLPACDQPPDAVADNTDCNDIIDYIHPGAVEVCDGQDGDCNGLPDDGLPTLTWYYDLDGDGHGNPAQPLVTCDPDAGGYALLDDDCNDDDPLAWTGNAEVCNDGSDNDCSGTVDGPDAVDALFAYDDLDNDGHGDPATGVGSCILDQDPLPPDDCNDADPLAWSGHPEVCDGSDNDCDGTTDGADATDAVTSWGDLDQDGHGDPLAETVDCEPPIGNVSTFDDCDDGEPLAWTGNTEVCDGADNDCSGDADGADALGASAWYADADGDGYGDPDREVLACEAPAGHVADDLDCDDGAATVHPGADSVPGNGIDEDCDGSDPVAADTDDPETGGGAVADAGEGGSGCGCHHETRFVPTGFPLLGGLIFLRRRRG
jgi:hypothetical protein